MECDGRTQKLQMGQIERHVAMFGKSQRLVVADEAVEFGKRFNANSCGF